MAKKKYRIYKAGGQKGKLVNPTAKFLAKAQMGMQQPSPEQMQMMEQQAMQQQGQPQMSEEEMMMMQQEQQEMLMLLIEEYSKLTQVNPEEIIAIIQEAKPEEQQVMIEQMSEVVQKANAGAEAQAEDPAQTMSKGGYVNKRVRQLKKAQEGMENSEQLSETPTINDTPDGRESLVQGFNSSLKNTAQDAVFKKQAQDEFDAGYARLGGGGRERRRARRKQRQLRRALSDTPMGYGINPFGVPSSGINVFAPAMMPQKSQEEIAKQNNAENSEVTSSENPQGINIKGNIKYGIFGRPKRYEFEMSGMPGAFTPYMGGMFGAGAMGSGMISHPEYNSRSGYYASGIELKDAKKYLVAASNSQNIITNADKEKEVRDAVEDGASDAKVKNTAQEVEAIREIQKSIDLSKPDINSTQAESPNVFPYTFEDGKTIMYDSNAPNVVSDDAAPITQEEFDKLPMTQQLEIMENQLKSNKYYSKGDQYASTSADEFKIDGTDRWMSTREELDLNKTPEEYPINFNAAYNKKNDKPETYIYDYENPPENYSDYISQVKRHRDWLRSNKVDNYHDGESVQWRHQDGEYKGQIRRDNAVALAKHRVLDYKIDQWENATEEEKAALESEYSKETAALNEENQNRKTKEREGANRQINVAKDDEASIDYYLQKELKRIDKRSISILDPTDATNEEFGRWYTTEELLNMEVPELNEKRIEDKVHRLKYNIEMIKRGAKEKGYKLPDLDSDNDEELLSKLKKYLSSFKEVTDDTYDYRGNENFYKGDGSGDLTPDAKSDLLEAYKNVIIAKKLKEHYENLSESEKAAYDEKVYNNQKEWFDKENSNSTSYNDLQWERYKNMTEGKPNENFSPDFERKHKKGGQVLKRYQRGGQPMLLSDMMMQEHGGQHNEEDPFAGAVGDGSANPLLSDMFFGSNIDPNFGGMEGMPVQSDAEFFNQFLPEQGGLMDNEYLRSLIEPEDTTFNMTSPDSLARQKKINEEREANAFEIGQIPEEEFAEESFQLNPEDLNAVGDSIKTQIDTFALENPDVSPEVILDTLGYLDNEDMTEVFMQALDSSEIAQIYMNVLNYKDSDETLGDTVKRIRKLGLQQDTQDTLIYLAKYHKGAREKITADDLSAPLTVWEQILLLGTPIAAVAAGYAGYKRYQNRMPNGSTIKDFGFKTQKRLPGSTQGPIVTPFYQKKLPAPKPYSGSRPWIRPDVRVGNTPATRGRVKPARVVYPPYSPRPNIYKGKYQSPTSGGPGVPKGSSFNKGWKGARRGGRFLGPLAAFYGVYDALNYEDGGALDRFVYGGTPMAGYGLEMFTGDDPNQSSAVGSNEPAVEGEETPEGTPEGNASSLKNPDGPMPGFTWEQWNGLTQEQQKQAIQGNADARNQYANQRQQVYQQQQGQRMNPGPFNPFGAFAGALTGMPFGMGSRQKMFERTGGYWKQTGFPTGTIDPENITKIHTEGKRGLFGPKGKMDIYFGGSEGSGEPAADGVPSDGTPSADGKKIRFPGMSYDERAERAQGRFDRKAQNAVERRARRDARPGERAARKDERKLNREERKFERNRRKDIRQGRGDTGGFDREAAIASRDAARQQAQAEAASPAATNPGYTGEKLDRFTAGDMSRKQLRKADFNRAERKAYRKQSPETANKLRSERRLMDTKQYGGYYQEGGEYDLSMEEIMEIMQAGGQIEFI